MTRDINDSLSQIFLVTWPSISINFKRNKVARKEKLFKYFERQVFLTKDSAKCFLKLHTIYIEAMALASLDQSDRESVLSMVHLQTVENVVALVVVDAVEVAERVFWLVQEV